MSRFIKTSLGWKYDDEEFDIICDNLDYLKINMKNKIKELSKLEAELEKGPYDIEVMEKLHSVVSSKEYLENILAKLKN